EAGTEGVVPDGAGAQLPRHLADLVDLLGENGRVQAVDGVVGDPDRILLVVGRDHREHRAEDLLLRDHRVVVHVPEHGGLDVPAANQVLGTAAAGGQGDRKSTRLNSSHTVISYAGFCLKK